MIFRRIALPIVLILTLIACAQTEKKTTVISDENEEHHHAFEATELVLPESEATYYNHHNKVFFTEHFSENDIETLKKWKVQTVIYLIEDVEPTPEMIERVEEGGMTVIPLDFQWEGKQARKLVAKIEKTFMLHHKEKKEVLVVASSNIDNVKAWLAYHLNKTHKMGASEALEASEALGAYGNAEAKQKAARLLGK